MRLKPVKNLPWCPVAGRSKMAVSAGVSVNATHPDTTTEMAMVMANCLYICPVTPSNMATGINTEHSTSTMAITGPVTSSMAWRDASLASRPVSCMMRSTFSTTTIASSTTMPMARTMANSVMVLML